MLFNTEHMLEALQKRKGEKGPSSSPQKKKATEKDKLKASTLPLRIPMIGLEASKASGATAWYGNTLA